MRLALDNWRDVNGWAIGHRISLPDLTPGQFEDFMWWWATHNMESKDRDKFERALWQPPRGHAGQGVWSAENETSGLMSLKSQVNGTA